MVPLLQRTALLGAVLVLSACGGSGSVKNGARLRFFNALNSQEDVRVYVADNLYAPGGSPRLVYGEKPTYFGVSTGTVDIVANAYAELSTPLVSLASQTLVKNAHYTAIGISPSGTNRIVLFEDGSAPDQENPYFRFINASTTYTRLYYTMRDPGGDSFGIQDELGVGTASDYQSPFSDGDTGDYVLRVYRDSNYTNAVTGDITIHLDDGKAATVFFYNGSDGDIRTRVVDDPGLTAD